MSASRGFTVLVLMIANTILKIVLIKLTDCSYFVEFVVSSYQLIFVLILVPVTFLCF